MPAAAAVLNFVIQYYEHFDNNNGADFKVAVQLPAGATSVEAWADNMVASIEAQVTATRKAAEEAAAAVERARTEAREAVRVR